MMDWITLARAAQAIEQDIERALTPMGHFIPQPFPWGQVLLTAGICGAVFFFFLIFLPRLASGIYHAGSLVTILIAVTLSLLLPFTIYSLRSPTKTLIEAAPGTVPKNASVTAITADSFTVEWVTQAEVVGMIKYGTTTDNLTFFALDEKGNIPTTSHRVRVENLLPKTKYFFEVVSGQIRFNDQGRPLEVETL